MSKAWLRPEAERLYVQEQLTLAEIASRLDISERTARDWCHQENWKEKRRQHEHAKRGFVAELYGLARSLARSVRRDLDAGMEVSQSRMYGAIRLAGLLVPDAAIEKEYREQETGGEKAEAVKSTDDLRAILKDVLGG